MLWCGVLLKDGVCVLCVCGFVVGVWMDGVVDVGVFGCILCVLLNMYMEWLVVVGFGCYIDVCGVVMMVWCECVCVW